MCLFVGRKKQRRKVIKEIVYCMYVYCSMCDLNFSSMGSVLHNVGAVKSQKFLKGKYR